MVTLSIAPRRLPSPPGVAKRIIELCRDDSSDLQLISDVIMADPALSAALLRFANSPAVAAPRSVASIRDGVLRLGVRAARLAALGFSLPVEIQERCRRFDLRAFWSESLLRAVVARHVVAHRLHVEREVAFTAALLAGIGRLALAHSFPSEYDALLQRSHSAADLPRLELERFGADHAGVGAQLLKQWGLPEALSEGVRSHLTATADDHPLARVIHLSQQLIEVALGEKTDIGQLDEVLTTLGLTEEEWAASVCDIDADYAATTQLFDVRLANSLQAVELLSQAQDESSRMGVIAQLETTYRK